MAAKVLFAKGSSVNFPSIDKDPNTLYFLNDSHEIYLGGERYAFGKDISVVITGVGDTVENVTFDASQKLLTLKLGEAADAPSIVAAIEDAVARCVKTITTDRGSAILVDDADPENVKLSLNLASGAHAGNVLLEECSDGLRANVEIPEDNVKGVAADEKVISLDEHKLLKSQLSITTVKEDGTTYVVLKGINNQEISRFDASEFVKDGMLESVRLEHAPYGSDHWLLVFVFNTDSGKETIKVDLNDLVDIYTAAEGGGLVLSDDGAFSIENTLEPSGGYINTDVAPGFGETITLHAIKYDAHGLIIGKGDFTFAMPHLSGEVGSGSKLLTRVSIDDSGALAGDTVDITNSLSASSTDSQIPTAKSVWTSIEDAKTVWESI